MTLLQEVSESTPAQAEGGQGERGTGRPKKERVRGEKVGGGGSHLPATVEGVGSVGYHNHGAP